MESEMHRLGYYTHKYGVDVGKAVEASQTAGVDIWNKITDADFDKIMEDMGQENKPDFSDSPERDHIIIQEVPGAIDVVYYVTPYEAEQQASPEMVPFQSLAKCIPRIKALVLRRSRERSADFNNEIDELKRQVLDAPIEQQVASKRKKKSVYISEGAVDYFFSHLEFSYFFYEQRKSEVLSGVISPSSEETSGYTKTKKRKNGNTTTDIRQRKVSIATFYKTVDRASEDLERSSGSWKDKVKRHVEENALKEGSVLNRFFNDGFEEKITGLLLDKEKINSMARRYIERGKFRTGSDAPEIYRWIERNTSTYDNPIVYVEAMAKAVAESVPDLSPKEKRDIRSIATKWVRVANAINHVRVETWAANFLKMQKDVEGLDFSSDLIKQILKTPHLYTDDSPEMIIYGVWAERMLYGKEESVLDIHTVESSYVLPVKHVLKKKNDIGKRLACGYKRIDSSLREASTEDDIYDSMTEDEKALPWINDPSKKMTSPYRRNIFRLWLRTYRHEIGNYI